MPIYEKTKLKNLFNITDIISVHYFEYALNFHFDGEKHDFWEIVYADQDDVVVTAGNSEFVLKRGYAVFHKPNEWHGIRTVKDSAASVAIISFSCKSRAMSFFENSTLRIGQYEKTLISDILAAFPKAFTTPLNDIAAFKLCRKVPPNPAAEQIILMRLSELLISLYDSKTTKADATIMRINRSEELCDFIIDYMQRNVNSRITIEMLEKFSGTSRATIGEVFREKGLKSPIAYFINLKISAAKKYLREGKLNITQIAEVLGYGSVHYFSRQFKAVTGVSPIEYSRSAKALGMIDDLQKSVAANVESQRP